MKEEVGAAQTAYVFSDATGRIYQTGSMPLRMLEQQKSHVSAGHQVVEGAGSSDKDYVLNGAIVPRPANPTTRAGMKLLNVPNPSSVTIDGANPHQVTDGEVDLEFTQPGTYTVTVSSWPALDATFTVIQP
jgi:hypothetical protein